MPAFQDWDSIEQPDRVRAVFYVRQSHKNETDSLASPLAQQRTCEAYIQSQLGWELVKPDGFQDIGISGYDPDAYRPGYEEMMQWVEDGKVDVVVIFALSRLTRQGANEALRIHGVMSKKGVGLVSTTEPFINTAHDNPFAVAFFALIAALAEQESKNKSKFIKNAFRELQERGSHSSGPVPYGMQAEPLMVDGVTIRRLKPDSVPEDSDAEPLHTNVIRMVELAEDGLAGNAIAAKLTADKVLIPSQAKANLAANLATGKAKRKTQDDAPAEWSATVVHRILRDPRIAGFAAVSAPGNKNLAKEILRDEHGEPIAPHTGIISPARWYALQEILNGNRKEKRAQRSGEEMTLLGSWGMLVCGKCDAPMTVSRTDGTYVCNLRRAVGSVPKHVLRVPMADADHVVSRAVWSRIMTLEPTYSEDDAELLLEAARRFAHNNANPELEAERLAVKAQLEHVEGSISRLAEERDLYVGKAGQRAWADQMRKLAKHEDECTRKLAALDAQVTVTRSVPLDAWTGGYEDPLNPEAPWGRWTTEERRGFLAIWAESVRVAPSPPRSEWGNSRDADATYRRVFDRVSVEWVKPPADEAGESHVI